jgi:glycosyltransferase involved in cell wall biosynthesis
VPLCTYIAQSGRAEPALLPAGGIPDYVASDCGWLIPKGDIASPIELIKQLCADKEIVRSRRENARAQALKFDWRRVAERLSVVYSAVCAGRSPSKAVERFEEAERRAQCTVTSNKMG